MLALGHVGITLLLYAPIAYLLLVTGRERAMATGLLVVVLLTPLPDIDMWLPFVEHRGITHSVVAAVCLGIVVGLAGWLSSLSAVARGGERAALGFLVGSLSIGSHLLGDVVTPMGLRPLYPVSGTWYTLDLVSAFNFEANRLLFLVGGVTFWLVLHHGRLRVAAGDTTTERTPAGSDVGNRRGTEHDRPDPTQPPISAGTPTRNRAGSEVPAPNVGD